MRRCPILLSPKKSIKVVFVLSIVSLVSINYVFRSNKKSHAENVRYKQEESPKVHLQENTHQVAIIRSPPLGHIEQQNPPLLNSSKIRFNESLRFIINDVNSRQYVANMHLYPPPKNGSYEFALVVQVHNRAQYFQYLVNSLREVKGHESSILIISHDFYSREIFDIVAAIEFMPVLQIFYSHSMQLYPDQYPGADPNDCPRDIFKAEAQKLKCNNADHPDLYGHYREAPYAQTKLHWFWKLQRVFEGLDIMKSFQGPVMLIEEDHYITPDALHVLRLMVQQQSTICPSCRILTLGNYDKNPSYQFHDQVVVAVDFISSIHNMAMCITRQVYELIKKYAKEFCEYDDYNWDWTLQHVGGSAIAGRLPTMIVKTPRVFHIGECGVHHKGKQCNPEEKVAPIRQRVTESMSKLFPSTLSQGTPTISTSLSIKVMKPNGGWGDKRDQKLCMSFMGLGTA